MVTGMLDLDIAEGWKKCLRGNLCRNRGKGKKMDDLTNLSDVEYYQLVLTHRDGHDSNIELPITAKAIVNPCFMQKLSCDECEALIDDLYRQLKEYWMLTRRNGERDGYMHG